VSRETATDLFLFAAGLADEAVRFYHLATLYREDPLEKEMEMLKKAALCAAALALMTPVARAQDSAEGDPYVLAAMNDFNNGILRAEWMDLRVQVQVQAEQVELLSLGKERAVSHLHRQPFRWVTGDPRRRAQGNGLTYLVDLAGGTDPKAAEAAVDRAMGTWGTDSCLQKSSLTKLPGGVDASIFDSLYGYGSFGDYRAADVVHAGWMPPDFFDRVTGPGGGKSVAALSVTFIYVDRNGNPSDLDGDGYLDVAHAEIYYNEGFSWEAGGLDLETVALHETGHALGAAHVSPPPVAVMNPFYAGPRRELRPIDHAAMCQVWAASPR